MSKLSERREDYLVIVDDTMITKAMELASAGLKNYEIASALEISISTFYLKCRESPELKAAVDKGRSFSIKKVTEKLYELALKGNVKAIEVYLGNARRHMPIHYSEATRKILKSKTSTAEEKMEAVLKDHVDGYIPLYVVVEMTKVMETLYVAKGMEDVKKRLKMVVNGG